MFRHLKITAAAGVLAIGLWGCQSDKHDDHHNHPHPHPHKHPHTHPHSAADHPHAHYGAEAAGHAHTDIERVAADMAHAAKHLWDSLTPEQQQKAAFEFADAERKNWHFIPRARKGLPWKEMTEPQRQLAHAMLVTGLSQRGYIKSMTIMSLEEVLRELEKGRQGGMVRDAELYYFSVFGKPAEKGTWGWRLEGHHLALNFTIADGKGIAAYPAFMGANPAEVRAGPRKGLRVLRVEEDLGRQLVKSLSAEQQAKAIFDKTAPKDVIAMPNRGPTLEGDPKGITIGEMTAQQKQLAQELLREYAYWHRGEMAEQELKKINDAGLDKVYFAWAGGTEPGVGHYYRLQGPTFLVEYDNTQNDANHIHTVWRDPKNEFGEDMLKRHYEQDHKSGK